VLGDAPKPVSEKGNLEMQLNGPKREAVLV